MAHDRGTMMMLLLLLVELVRERAIPPNTALHIIARSGMDDLDTKVIVSKIEQFRQQVPDEVA